MLLLPGWAILSVGQSWRRWTVLQRWVLAAGLSAATYPVLFYGTRTLLPWIVLAPAKLAGLLVLASVVVVWRMRSTWQEQFAFDRLEWVALAVFGMTLFTRLLVIKDRPYPAWTDSLHHVLLTRLTASQGRLPFDMQPYFPVSLDRYHLGLYSLSASVEWLARVPSHTALLFTSQVLNGLCGLGVYLVLERRTGRLGAVVGAAVVGLASHQPAYYVNWGRFTQVAGQTLILYAWVMVEEALSSWRSVPRASWLLVGWNTLCAAGLVGAVFLMHFRVGVFLVPLVALGTLWDLWKARGLGQLRRSVAGLVCVAGASLAVAGLGLWQAIPSYIEASQTPPSTVAEITERAAATYYQFPVASWRYSIGSWWLTLVAGACAVAGLARRDRIAVISVLWVACLVLLANTYQLSLPVVNLTNLGAVLIMLYLPIGLVIGSATEGLVRSLGPATRRPLEPIVAAGVVCLGFVFSHVRVRALEPSRYFVGSGDVAAMEWIVAHTPADAFFAVNADFWMPGAPHGTDGGYWIPYFTGRSTTAGIMLMNLAPHEYWGAIVRMSQAEERLETNNDGLDDLRDQGVAYIYDGPGPDWVGAGLDVTRLVQADGVNLVYERDGVTILEIAGE